jgi:hypothetical protein
MKTRYWEAFLDTIVIETASALVEGDLILIESIPNAVTPIEVRTELLVGHKGAINSLLPRGKYPRESERFNGLQVDKEGKPLMK